MMSGVGYRFRIDLRRRWPAWVGLGVLAGTFGGGVLGAFAAAERTESVVERMIARTDPPHIYYIPEFQDTKLTLGDLAPLPSVEFAVGTHWYVASLADDPSASLEGLAFPQQDALRWQRMTLVDEGRHADLDAIDEVTINHLTRDEFGLRVGQRIGVQLAAAGWEPDTEPEPGLVVEVTIVGVTVAAGDLPAVAEPGITFTPAFDARYENEASWVNLVMLRLRDGDYDAFARDMRVATDDQPVFYAELRAGLTQVERSFDLQVVALQLLGGFLAAVTMLVFGQTLARQLMLDAADHPALHSLGASRVQLFAAGIARTVTIALVAAPVAFGVAVASSSVTPIGAPRLAEPDRGIILDVGTMLGGAALVGVVLVALSLWPAWRAANSLGAGTRAGAAAGRSPIARGIAVLARRPVAGIGVRFALGSGADRSSVPTRSAFVASTAALVAVGIAIVIGASLDRLVSTPRLFGWNWDIGLPGTFEPGGDDLADLVATEGVRDVGIGVVNVPFTVNGTQAEGFGITPVYGDLGPVILEGRAPRTDDEVAIGPKTLDSLDLSIGDRVELGLQGIAATTEATIVGSTVLPLESDLSVVGEGLWVRHDVVRAIYPGAPIDGALIRVDPAAREAIFAKLFDRYGEEETLHAIPPSAIVDFGRMRALPLLLAGILAILAAGTVAHLLMTSIRRRRRDLAILKTLGLVRSQVRGVIAWQATTFVAISALFAIPIGIGAGRWIWHLIAGLAGFAPSARAPGLLFLLLLAASLLTANLVGVIPARIAARTSPSHALRRE